MRSFTPFLVLALALLVGCDKVDKPYGDSDGPAPSTASVPRKVLLEDLTGHRCNNCPEAAVIAQQLVSTYGDRLVVVGVHMMENFAAPGLPLGDDSLDTDFRTEAGNTYETAFNITSLPKGLIDRKPYNGAIAVGRFSWSSAVGEVVDLEADYKLWFDTVHYDLGTNTVTATIKTLCARTVSGTHNLTVYLTEDHVVDGQIDQNATPAYVPNYEHRHVLRKALNSAWGQALITGGATAGDTLTTEISYPLPDNVLVASNCALVAYVYSTIGANQYEVEQVEQHELIP